MAEELRLRVESEPQWTRLVEATCREYLDIVAFPEALHDMVVGALSEACEELTRAASAAGAPQPFEAVFEREDSVLTLRVIYNEAIPLNPHKAPNYEVPDSGANLEDVEVETLWLHLIKRRMDRVFFRVNGRQRELVLMKYPRVEGKSRQFWVMGLMPRLRPDVQLDYPPGEENAAVPTGATLHDPKSGSVLRLSRSDAFIVRRFDGRTTFHDIYLEHSAELGPIAPTQLARIYETLEAAGMLARSGQNESKWKKWFRWIIAPRLSIPRADALVTAVHGWVRPLLNRWGFAALLLLGLSGIIPVVRNWDRFVAAVPELERMIVSEAWTIPVVYALMLVLVGFHELAHGVVCKHFGGRVPNLGIMWYLASFIFFCDTSAAWNFRQKSQRILVSLAGPLVTWASLGVIAWLGASSIGSPWLVVWALLAVINTFSLAMNFNPLIKMDAYYMLMDWTGIPDLQRKSFAYVKRLFSRSAVASGRPPSVRERRVFLIYGVLSAAMSIVFLVWPLVTYVRRLAEWRASTGQLVVAGLLLLIILSRLGQRTFAHMHAATHQEHKIV